MRATDWAQEYLDDIYAQPHARAPRVQYGKALRSRGDPLGDLIGWEADGDRPKAQWARAELWPRLRGDLAEDVLLIETWMGFPKTVRGPLRAPCDGLRTVERVEGASTLSAAMSTLGALQSIEVDSAADLEVLLREDVHVKSVWPLRVDGVPPARLDAKFRADRIAIGGFGDLWEWAGALAPWVEHVHVDTWNPPPEDFEAGGTRCSWRGGGDAVDVVPCSRADELRMPPWFRFEPIELLWRQGSWSGVLGRHEGEPRIAVLTGGETEHQGIPLHAPTWAPLGPGPWRGLDPAQLCRRATAARPHVNGVSELFNGWCHDGNEPQLILGNADQFVRTKPGMPGVEHLLGSRANSSNAWAAHNTSSLSAWWAEPKEGVWVVTQGYDSGRPVEGLAYRVLDAFSAKASFPERVGAISRAAEAVDPLCGWVSVLALGRHEGRILAAGVGMKILYRLRDGAFEAVFLPDTLGRRCEAEGVAMTSAERGYFVPIRGLKAGELGDLDVVEIDARAGDRLVLCVGTIVEGLRAQQVHQCVATGSARDAVRALNDAGVARAGHTWWSAFSVVDL